MSNCIIVFVKAPVPGQVKTRLTSDISPEQAAVVYEAFLLDWCEALASVPSAALVVAYTPENARESLQNLIRPTPLFIPQVGDTLGERLIAATQWARSNAYRNIVLVGSDSPTLPVSYVQHAFDLLASHDVVIGPSVDGGYYLIGFSTQGVTLALPTVFEGIEWSTSVVFRQTVEKIASTRARLGLLPPWYDVDGIAELRFLHAHLHAMKLAGENLPAPRTYEILLGLLEG